MGDLPTHVYPSTPFEDNLPRHQRSIWYAGKNSPLVPYFFDTPFRIATWFAEKTNLWRPQNIPSRQKVPTTPSITDIVRLLEELQKPAFRSDIIPAHPDVYENLEEGYSSDDGFQAVGRPDTQIESTDAYRVYCRENMRMGLYSYYTGSWYNFSFISFLQSTAALTDLESIETKAVHAVGQFFFSNSNLTYGVGLHLFLLRYEGYTGDIEDALYADGIVVPQFDKNVYILAQSHVYVPPIDPESNQTDWHTVPFALTAFEPNSFDFRGPGDVFYDAPKYDRDYRFVVYARDYAENALNQSYKGSFRLYTWYEPCPFTSDAAGESKSINII